MADQRISKLESYIEKLVEGTFANLFGETITVRNVALQLARKIETDLRYDRNSKPPLVAPSHYRIMVHADTKQRLDQSDGELHATLRQYIIEICKQFDYCLQTEPHIDFQLDSTMDGDDLRIVTRHVPIMIDTTATMTSPNTQINVKQRVADHPHIIVNGADKFDLEEHIINIGRALDNDIVVSDPYVSRYQLQLRSRFGGYVLFDVQNKGKTKINEITLTEHQLQPNDVILIGRTQLVYLEDALQQNSQTIPLELDDKNRD